MKKEAVLVISILLISMVSISFVSAGLGDIWNKITGKVTEENETATCTDSDGGNNVYISGKACSNAECALDGCHSDGSLSETYCEGGEIKTERYDCSHGCLDGACIEELTEEPESEPASEENNISCTDSDGGQNYYKKGETYGISPSGGYYHKEDVCVGDNLLVEYYCIGKYHTGTVNVPFTCPYGCRDGACLKEPPPEPPDEQCNTGDEKYYTCEDGTKVLQCKCENNMWVCKISPENECPEGEVETCAGQIKINFNKNSYVVGEQFELKIGVFDSQEKPIPNYAFYAEMYDDRWHTPDLQRTGGDGYLRHTGTAEKLSGGITKVRFKVYTREIGSCGVVEDTTEVEIRQAPVPCGIGGCVPEPECKDKIRKCGGDCPPCPEERNKTDIFYPCSGCEVGGRCYPVGYRKEGQYCSIDYKFVNQMEEGKCDNNFECKSNVCVSGECIGEGLIKKIIAWFKRLFGGEEEPKEKADCSKLLIEKDIGDNEYEKSGYGENEHTQVPVYSEDGENIGTKKCCMADYSTAATIICPFDSREDVKNSLKWILAGGEVKSFTFEEYKGEKVIKGNEGIIIWTNEAYIVASGGKPGAGNKFVEEIVGAYFKKYPSDFDITEDDIPYVNPEPPKPWVSCTEEDEIAVKKCVSISGSRLQTDPHPDKDCEVYVGCILPDEDCEKITDIKEKEECYIKAQELPTGDSVKEFLKKAEILGEITLIDFETLPDGTVLENGDRLTGKEWESLGVTFEFPSEDYLQVFGPKYPFNPLDKLSLSPGLGPFEAGGDTHDDLNIIFSEPVKAIGIYLLDLGPDISESESISFLDTNGNVIEKISPWPGPSFGNPAPGTFVSLIHDGISRIEILEDTQDGDDIAYDNLYFVK